MELHVRITEADGTVYERTYVDPPTTKTEDSAYRKQSALRATDSPVESPRIGDTVRECGLWAIEARRAISKGDIDGAWACLGVVILMCGVERSQ